MSKSAYPRPSIVMSCYNKKSLETFLSFLDYFRVSINLSNLSSIVSLLAKPI